MRQTGPYAVAMARAKLKTVLGSAGASLWAAIVLVFFALHHQWWMCALFAFLACFGAAWTREAWVLWRDWKRVADNATTSVR